MAGTCGIKRYLVFAKDNSLSSSEAHRGGRIITRRYDGITLGGYAVAEFALHRHDAVLPRQHGSDRMGGIVLVDVGLGDLQPPAVG